MNKRSIKALGYQTERDPLSFPSLKMPEQDDIDAKDLSFVLVPHKEEPQTRDEKFKDDIIKEKIQKQWKDEQLTYNEIYRSRGPYYQPPSQGQRQNQLFPQGLRGDKKMKKSYTEIKASLMKKTSFNELKKKQAESLKDFDSKDPNDYVIYRDILEDGFAVFTVYGKDRKTYYGSHYMDVLDHWFGSGKWESVVEEGLDDRPKGSDIPIEGGFIEHLDASKKIAKEITQTEYELACPSCQTVFKFAGSEPFMTECPNCGEEVNAQHSINKLAKGEGVMEDVGEKPKKKKTPKKEEPKEEKKEEPKEEPKAETPKEEVVDVDPNKPPTEDEMAGLVQLAIDMSNRYEGLYAQLRPIQKAVEEMRKTEVTPFNRKMIARLEQYLKSINEQLEKGKEWTGWLKGIKVKIEIGKRHNPAYAKLYEAAYSKLSNEGKQELDKLAKQLTSISESVSVTVLSSKIRRANWFTDIGNKLVGWLSGILNGLKNVNHTGEEVVQMIQGEEKHWEEPMTEKEFIKDVGEQHRHDYDEMEVEESKKTADLVWRFSFMKQSEGGPGSSWVKSLVTGIPGLKVTSYPSPYVGHTVVEMRANDPSVMRKALMILKENIPSDIDSIADEMKYNVKRESKKAVVDAEEGSGGRIEQGACPNCGSDGLNYGEQGLDGNSLYYNCKCEDCGWEGREWYNLEFTNYETILRSSKKELKESISFADLEKKSYLTSDPLDREEFVTKDQVKEIKGKEIWYTVDGYDYHGEVLKEHDDGYDVLFY